MIKEIYTFDEDIVSDLHKDAYGFRPTGNFWPIWNKSSNREKQVIWDDLLESLDRAVNAEKNYQEMAAINFETRITEIQNLMNNTRWDAIRVIIQAEGEEENVAAYGYEALEYTLGLKFDYIQASL